MAATQAEASLIPPFYTDPGAGMSGAGASLLLTAYDKDLATQI